MTWLKAFIASKASGWLAVAGLAVVSGLLIYIQQLRIEAAHCKGRESVQGQVDALTDKVVRQIDEQSKTDVAQVRSIDDECARNLVPSAVVDRLRE